jgi:hypothetical protein
MNATVPEPARWSPRRWIYTVAAVFVLQAGLLLYLGQRAGPLPARPTFRTAVYLVVDPWSNEQLSRLPTLSNPMLFAMPGEDGFSGPAWLRPAPIEFQPRPWSEPLRWLDVDEQALGGDFTRFVATNAITPPLTANKQLPPLLRYEPNVPNASLPQFSRLRLEGELASRPLLTPLQLRSWPNPDVLGTTIIQAAVDADGFTHSAVILGECGLKEADLQALKLANQARFRPLPRAVRDRTGNGPLAWGKLIFQWHTLPMAATNLTRGQF